MRAHFAREYMVVDFGLTGMDTDCSGARKLSTFSHEIRHNSVQALLEWDTLLIKPFFWKTDFNRADFE